ncbi:MAG: extracellular solute-binding protein [bacterium]|nr:extracellular solute-binding protein [bacterium]
MSSGKVAYKPLYVQVKDVILTRIKDELYKDGESIPTETQLAEEFGTSISTIRQALTLLVNDGILIKKQGKGTFVSRQKTKLRFFSWLPETTRGKKILHEVISRFEVQNPSIAIECIPSPYNQARKNLIKLISSGNAPDVAHIQSHWTSYFASKAAFENLEPLLDKANLGSRFYEKDLCGGMYGDTLYSIAWGLCPVAMLANTRALREAGIPQLASPVSVDEFWSACRQFDRFYEGGDKYSYALNVSLDQESDFLTLYIFLLTFGGGFVNEQGEVVFNSPGNVEAFSWLRDFVDSLRIYTSNIHDLRKRFARGDIAFMADGPWIKYQLEEYSGEPFDENFEVLLIPVRNQNEKSRSWTYNHALSICAQSQYKAQAAKFIDSISNDPDISNLYYSQVGHLPTNRGYLDDPLYDSAFFRAYKQQLSYSSCMDAKNTSFSKAMIFCIDAVKKILYDGVDVEQELNEKEHYLNMLYSD